MCNQISRKTFAVTLSKRILWLDQRPETANTGMLVMCKQERNLKHKFDNLHLFATILMRWYILMVKSKLHQTRSEPCKVQVQPKCSPSPALIVKVWQSVQVRLSTLAAPARRRHGNRWEISLIDVQMTLEFCHLSKSKTFVPPFRKGPIQHL